MRHLLVLAVCFAPLPSLSFSPNPALSFHKHMRLLPRVHSGGVKLLVGVDIEKSLLQKNIVIPEPGPPAANYDPFVVTGKYVYISGQLPMQDGQIKYTGKVGTDVSIEDGYQSARQCGLNIIAQAKAACGGDLNKIKRIVKLVGFVNCNPDFFDQPKVINGASDVMIEVFGDIGRHARSAVGTNALPFNVATEVEAVVEIDYNDEFGVSSSSRVDKRGVPLRIEPGMKVEAVDRKFKDIITVGTIKDVKENKVLIGFDGWTDDYDYWCDISDGDFQPPGTVMRAKARLSPPNGYVGYFDWGSYLEETGSIPAPPQVFQSAAVFPSFKGDVSIKFELWHRMEATVVPLPPSPQEMERESQQNNK